MTEIDEAELLGAGRSGTIVEAAMDDGKRPVQAALLRRCCHELKDQIDPRGLRLNNAVVVGCLDLAGLTVPFPLRFDGCEFDSAVVVESAELIELSLTGCPRLPGLLGNGLRLRRDLNLSRSHLAGAHWTSELPRVFRTREFAVIFTRLPSFPGTRLGPLAGSGTRVRSEDASDCSAARCSARCHPALSGVSHTQYGALARLSARR